MKQINRKSSAAQKGATLIIALIMLLIVTLIGLSGLFGVTLQEKQVNTLSENRALYSEANNLLLSAISSISNTTPDSIPNTASNPPEGSVTPAIGTVRYEDFRFCNSVGDDDSQPFICKAAIATVGFDDGSGAIDDDNVQLSYTQMYKYRINLNNQ